MGVQLPLLWNILLQSIRPSFVILALHRVCQYAANPFSCKAKAGILNIIAGVVMPILCAVFLEKRDRQRFLESLQIATESGEPRRPLYQPEFLLTSQMPAYVQRQPLHRRGAGRTGGSHQGISI
jgi:hypothetical protein